MATDPDPEEFIEEDEQDERSPPEHFLGGVVSRAARPDGARHHRRSVSAVSPELARADAEPARQAPGESERARDTSAHPTRTGSPAAPAPAVTPAPSAPAPRPRPKLRRHRRPSRIAPATAQAPAAPSPADRPVGTAPPPAVPAPAAPACQARARGEGGDSEGAECGKEERAGRGGTRRVLGPGGSVRRRAECRGAVEAAQG